ncbi:type IV pilus modification protein PilV [Aquabacterium olei]|nr:type IV pilus modification protein PilV [Aquabacterium olei]
MARWSTPGGRRRAMHGATLIEVLVALLIVALGMVSMAALQSATLKYQRGSSQRALLSVLLSDYAERVRANLDQAPGVVAASPYLHAVNWSTQAASAVSAAARDCATETCDAAQLAAYDMAQWRASVRRSLPLGAVFVQGTAARGLTVTFMWADKELTGAGGTLGAAAASTAAAGEAALASASRCPAAAGAAVGVRCANFTVMP